MAVTITNLFAGSMVITTSQNSASPTVVSYIDSEDNTWQESFNIAGDLDLDDIVPGERSTRSATRAGMVYEGPWITAIACGASVTGIFYDTTIVTHVRDAISRLNSLTAPNVTSIGDYAFSNT